MIPFLSDRCGYSRSALEARLRPDSGSLASWLRPSGWSRPSPGNRLELTPSRVAFTLFAGRPGLHAPDAAAMPADEEVADLERDFGFPFAPAAAGVDAGGRLFDTTASTVTEDADTIRYRLHFGGRTQPYSLVHDGAGTYRSSGAVMDFRWGDRERFQQLDTFLDRGGSYRVVVRDVVQLYEPAGPFDWSVTRADFADGATGAPVVSLLYVVWDEDGPENEPAADPRGDPGVPAEAPGGPQTPTFPADVTPTVGGAAIEQSARRLAEAGHWTEDVEGHWASSRR